MTEKTYKIADHIVEIKYQDDGDLDLLQPFRPFVCKKPLDGKTLLCMEVGNNLSDANPEGEEVGQFDCGGNNHGVYKTDDGYKFLISNPNGLMCISLKTTKDF